MFRQLFGIAVLDRRDQFVVMDVIRDEILPTFSSNIRTSVQEVAVIGGGGAQNAAIQFVINGPDLKKLEVLGNQLVQRVKAIPGVVDIDTSLNTGKPELSVHVDRPKAADLGVQISDAAEALRLLVGGDQVTTYNDAGEQYEVHLRAKAEADALAKAQAKAQAVSDARAAAIAKAQIAAANAQVAAASARTAASADVVCSIYDSQGSVLSYSFNGGFDSGALAEVGFTKNGAVLQPAGAIQPVWTSERDNGRVVLRSTHDMGWLITVAPNSNALLMTPAGRVAGTGNCG